MDDVGILLALVRSFVGVPKYLLISADAFTNQTIRVVA